MRYLSFACLVFLAAAWTSSAWGQNGLYGSPQLIQVPQQSAAQDSQIPAAYPSTGTPVPQTAPAPTYQPTPPPTCPQTAPVAYQAAATPIYPQTATSYQPASTYQPTPVPTSQPVPTPIYQQTPTPTHQPAPTYQPAPAPTYQQTATTTYQSPPATSYQPAPVPTQQYMPAQTNIASAQQPRYRYPAQTPTTALYQPYQSGAKYQYPAPALRPAGRTAYAQPVAQEPPMPVPPNALANPSTLTPIPADPNPMPLDGQTQQTPSLTNQMLQEQGVYPGNNACGQMGPSYGNGCGMGRADSCGPATSLDGCEVGSFCKWYASVSALVMGRSDGRRLWTSYQDGNLSNQLTNTQFGLQWRWGGEVRFGRRFCWGCNPDALEATFWTTQQFEGSRYTSLMPGGYVSTPLIVSYLNFGGVSGTAWFDGAQSHTLSRQDEFQNLEVNFIREELAMASDSPWDVGWMVGIRYFRFREMLTFSAVSQLGNGDAYLQDSITDNLIGPQVGFDAAYNLAHGLRLFITPKVGVYDNIMESTFQARARSGSGAYIDATSSEGTFPAHGTKVGLSFLTQIDLGADWQFSKNWSARVGYRVLAITGMGLADDQFPQYINDVPEIQNVSHSSSLVLHGAFVGLECNF